MTPEELSAKIDQIHYLISEVRAFKVDHPEHRYGFYLNPGSILNAYREGDLSFDACVDALEYWRAGGRIQPLTERGGGNRWGR